MRKSDEQPKQFFRAAARLYCLNGEWYFQTREEDRGPYTCREAAETALERYSSEMSDLHGMQSFDGIEYDFKPDQEPDSEFTTALLDD